MIWWHRFLGHSIRTTRVSVPMWDFGSKGLFIRCSCGKDWAK